MLYFAEKDYACLLDLDTEEAGLRHLYERLSELHRALYPHLQQKTPDLYLYSESPGGVRRESASAPTLENVLALTYMRLPADARIVEGLMGRDTLHNITSKIEARRHPVIEIRLMPEALAVELIVSPEAWYDQQNFIGKLSVEQYRHQFYRLLSGLPEAYMLGFWHGVHLGDMHLNTAELPPERILFDYLDTFADRRDWLRIGHWYAPESPALQEESIVGALAARVRDLYGLYTFVAWAAQNNFHSLYQRLLSHPDS